MPVFETRLPLPGPAERVFDFLTRPANLKQISPPEIQMAFVEVPEVFSLGSRFSFRIVVMGQIQEFEHEITEFERPFRFRETAISTPMKLWVQDYQLEPGENGLVVLHSRVEFEPPGGLLGYILTPDRILANLDEGHAHRSEALLQALT